MTRRHPKLWTAGHLLTGHAGGRRQLRYPSDGVQEPTITHT